MVLTCSLITGTFPPSASSLAVLLACAIRSIRSLTKGQKISAYLIVHLPGVDQRLCPRSSTSPRELLIDYDGVRYHFLLEYNFEFPESKENRYLQKIYDLNDMVERPD